MLINPSVTQKYWLVINQTWKMVSEVLTTFAQSKTLIFPSFAFISVHTKYGCRRTFRCLVSLDSCWRKVVGTWHTLYGMCYNFMPKLTYCHRIITWPTSYMCHSKDQMIFFKFIAFISKILNEWRGPWHKLFIFSLELKFLLHYSEWTKFLQPYPQDSDVKC